MKSKEIAIKRFNAAIVDVDADEAADGTRAIRLLPPDCESLRKPLQEGAVVRFPESELPGDMEFSALVPADERYWIVTVTAELENVMWFHGRSDGTLYFRGVTMQLDRTLDCQTETN